MRDGWSTSKPSATRRLLAALLRWLETVDPRHPNISLAMEYTLPDDHPDMIRIVQAAHRDLAPPPAKGQANALANALASALGNAPGRDEDLENIEFLVHVLAVNRASGAIDDEIFAQLLQRISTKEGRADLTRRFTEELEAEHGYADED